MKVSLSRYEKAHTTAQWNAHKQSPLPAIADMALLEKEVSSYAITSKGEFVAEVDAGTKARKNYSPHVWEIYKECLGVKP